VEVENVAHLFPVGTGVRLDLLRRQAGSRLAPARGITDPRRIIADDEDDLVSKLLELAKLADGYRVADVQVRPRRVEALLDPERLAAPDGRLELARQI